MRGEPDTKPSGGDSSEGPHTLDETVDEASMESFPCSDPPAFNACTLGAPHGSVDRERDVSADVKREDAPRAAPLGLFEAVRASLEDLWRRRGTQPH